MRHDVRQAVRRHPLSQMREFVEEHAAALPIGVTSIEIVEWSPSREVLPLCRMTGHWPAEPRSLGRAAPHAHGTTRKRDRARTDGEAADRQPKSVPLWRWKRRPE